MRTIKFRAWVTKFDKPVMYNDLYQINNLGNVPVSFEVSSPDYVRTLVFIGSESSPLMQFTGLLDKNGKEIYEGDVLKYLIHYPHDFQERNPKKKFGRIAGPVLWDKGWLYLDYEGEDKVDNTLLYESEARDWEIIGNIYSNPELLK